MSCHQLKERSEAVQGQDLLIKNIGVLATHLTVGMMLGEGFCTRINERTERF